MQKRTRRPHSGRTNQQQFLLETAQTFGQQQTRDDSTTATDMTERPKNTRVEKEVTHQQRRPPFHPEFALPSSRPSTASLGSTSSGSLSSRPSTAPQLASTTLFSESRRERGALRSGQSVADSRKTPLENENEHLVPKPPSLKLPPRPNTVGSSRRVYANAGDGEDSARAETGEQATERLLGLFRDKAPQKFKSPRKAFIAMSMGGPLANKAEFERVAKTIGVLTEETRYDDMFQTVSARSGPDGLGFHTFLKELWPDDRVDCLQPSCPQRPTKYLFLRDRSGSSQSSRIRNVFNENAPIQDGNDGNYSSVTYNILHMRDEFRPKRPHGVSAPSTGYSAFRESRSYPGMPNPFASEVVVLLVHPTH